ncbi:MAG TPA: low molecular weight phosphotyrosine protein phosphatase, partial [Paludibacter sp.]
MIPTSILFVCLGNICRSPMAEGVFLSILEREGQSSNFNIDSAGTLGVHIGEL